MKILGQILCMLGLHQWIYGHSKKRDCSSCGKSQLKFTEKETWQQTSNDNGWRFW